jgi:allantoin racemase
MKLCYIGPAGRTEALQKFLSPGVVLESRTTEGGPESIESMWEEYLSIPGTMELAVQLEKEGFDAIIPGCVGDPGIDGIRELVSIPVIGPGATSMQVAAGLGHSFSVLTILDSVIRPTEHLAHTAGVASKLASVRSIGIPVLELNDDLDRTFDHLVSAARQAIEQDRAEVLVIGCGTLSFRSEELQEAVGVPVVNPLRAALRMAELLISSGLSHSKISYPTPPKLAAAQMELVNS